MEQKNSGSVKWIEFDLLADIKKLKHAVFQRHGGCSKGHYDSLNLSHTVGDQFEDVNKNIDAIKKICSIEELVWAKQCHKQDIFEATAISNEPPCVDVLVTNKLQKGLMITHADCQAAVIYDPINHAVANVHCGWRGSVQNVYRSAIQYMQDRYHSKAANLLVCISPSLGPEDAQFINYKTELPESFWDFQHRADYFDFWEISRMQLRACGVLNKHIEIAGISTYSQNQDYFSFRRSAVTGRNATVVVLQ